MTQVPKLLPFMRLQGLTSMLLLVHNDGTPEAIQMVDGVHFLIMCWGLDNKQCLMCTRIIVA